jgi:hypothetical protein
MINNSESKMKVSVSFTQLVHRTATKNVEIPSELQKSGRGQSFSTVLPKILISDEE